MAAMTPDKKKNRSRLQYLSLSAVALVAIAGYEGYRGQAYDDGVGVQTIGYGTTRGVKRGDTITPDKAMARLLNDAWQFEAAIKSCVTVPLYQHEYDAAVTFAYNIGGPAFCGSTMVKKWNARDYAGGCAELSRWVYAGGRKLPGLVNRRAAEYKMCMGE